MKLLFAFTIFFSSQVFAATCAELTDDNLLSEIWTNGCIVKSKLLIDYHTANTEPVADFGYGGAQMYFEGKQISTPEFDGVYSNSPVLQIWASYDTALIFDVPAGTNVTFSFDNYFGPPSLYGLFESQDLLNLQFNLFAHKARHDFFSTIGEFKEVMKNVFTFEIVDRP